MSAASHENYTRKWANALKVPLFSIDYRLAPENPYPKPLDDVFQAYMWIIKYSETVLNISIKNIILAGDSAGGNLVAALTYLLILEKAKLPTDIFLAYPGNTFINISIGCKHHLYVSFLFKCA
jgi:hormone-sensitive lipase